MSDRDLATALAETGTELNWEQSVRFSVSAKGSRIALHPIVEDELYWIGREAIANAFRHAGASQIDVEINSGGRAVRLRRRDNGRGIDPEVLQCQGKGGDWGCPGMRERSDKIGAVFECWSAPGRGTEIVVTVSAGATFAVSGAIGRLFRRRTAGTAPLGSGEKSPERTHVPSPKASTRPHLP